MRDSNLATGPPRVLVRARAGAIVRSTAFALVAAIASFAPAAARGTTAAGEAFAVLHPSLREAAGDPAAPTRVVAVCFRDKGVAPGEDTRRALERAGAALSERSLHRRLRAGVVPLVDARDLPVHAGYLEALARGGLRPLAVSRWLNRAVVRADGRGLATLAALPFVIRVFPLAPALRADDAPATLLPDDDAAHVAGEARPATTTIAPGLTAGALGQIGAIGVQDSGYTGAGVLIAVFDEGFNGHDVHQALAAARPAPGRVRDFVDGDTTVTDAADPFGFDHGTEVLGPLVGNRPGTYLGAAPGAALALARTEQASFERRVEMHWWAMAAEWADSLGAEVISSSLGYSTFDAPESSLTPDSLDGATAEITVAARIAAAKGILVVNSAGNGGQSSWRSVFVPADANGDSVLAVGAVDASGALAGFSSLGPTADGRIKPDLVALGVNVPVTVGAGAATYGASNGTSFSAPLAAGLAACLLEARPAWRPVDVIAALKATASRAGAPDNRLGWGIPNGGAALCWTPGRPLPPAPGRGRLLGPNPHLAGGPDLRAQFTVGGFLPGAFTGRADVHDATGRRVRTLWRGPAARGQCVDVRWNGRDEGGERVPPGIYYISLSAGGETSTVRVVALR